VAIVPKLTNSPLSRFLTRLAVTIAAKTGYIWNSVPTRTVFKAVLGMAKVGTSPVFAD
jgi:hypothetical protein